MNSQVLDRLSGVTKEMTTVGQKIASFHNQFVLPQSNELSSLINQFEKSDFAVQLRQLRESGHAIMSAMEAMRTPWLDIQNSLQSLNGFAELQNIGLAVQRLSSFGEGLADQLRVSLGDWRDAITWPKDIFNDALARTAFYVDKGFDPRLTDFCACSCSR